MASTFTKTVTLSDFCQNNGITRIQPFKGSERQKNGKTVLDDEGNPIINSAWFATDKDDIRGFVSSNVTSLSDDNVRVSYVHRNNANKDEFYLIHNKRRSLAELEKEFEASMDGFVLPSATKKADDVKA